MRALSAKYDRAQALLQRDRDALATQQAELEDARAAAGTEAARAASAAAEAARRLEELRAQVSDVQGSSSSHLRRSLCLHACISLSQNGFAWASVD